LGTLPLIAVSIAAPFGVLLMFPNKVLIFVPFSLAISSTALYALYKLRVTSLARLVSPLNCPLAVILIKLFSLPKLVP